MIKFLSIIIVGFSGVILGAFLVSEQISPENYLMRTPLPGFTAKPITPSQSPKTAPQPMITPKPRVTTPKSYVDPYLQYQWDCNKKGGKARISDNVWICDLAKLQPTLTPITP